MRSFQVPIFGSRVFITQDPEEASEWCDFPLKDVNGFCANVNGKIFVYVEDDDPALLAHECLHAAGYTLEYSHIESRDEELMANLMQYIMTECSKRLPQ